MKRKTSVFTDTCRDDGSDYIGLHQKVFEATIALAMEKPSPSGEGWGEVKTQEAH